MTMEITEGDYNSLRDIVAIDQDRAIAAIKREQSCLPAVRKLLKPMAPSQMNSRHLLPKNFST